MNKILIAVAIIMTPACMNLDFMWFSPTPVEAYELPDNHIPEDLIEEVSFESTDGVTIHGVYAARDDDGPRAGLTLYYLHGNADNIDTYWDRVMLLWDMGYNVFAIDYRGFGRSTGVPSEEGVYDDASAGLAYMIGRSDWPSTTTVYYGYSLGSAVAINLSVEHPPAALITESALASSQAFVEDALRLPLASSMFMDSRFDSLGKLGDVHSPVLLMHGTADDFVRFEFSELLVDAANEPRRLVPAEGATHGDEPGPGVPTALGDLYELEVGGWADHYALELE